MQLNIVNESSYKNLNIICNGNTFSLNKENTITSLDIYDNTNVESVSCANIIVNCTFLW